jgi:hypothetical protein
VAQFLTLNIIENDFLYFTLQYKNIIIPKIKYYYIISISKSNSNNSKNSDDKMRQNIATTTINQKENSNIQEIKVKFVKLINFMFESLILVSINY